MKNSNLSSDICDSSQIVFWQMEPPGCFQYWNAEMHKMYIFATCKLMIQTEVNATD